jgi:hypothetical protein
LSHLVEQEAIGQLKARYCRFLDQHKWDEREALFTADAQLQTFGTTTVGNHAIRRMVEDSMADIASSHQAFCPEIIITSPDTAKEIWPAMFIRSQGRTTGVGHYHEHYRKVQGCWLISACELVTMFVEGSTISDHLIKR